MAGNDLTKRLRYLLTAPFWRGHGGLPAWVWPAEPHLGLARVPRADGALGVLMLTRALAASLWCGLISICFARAECGSCGCCHIRCGATLCCVVLSCCIMLCSLVGVCCAMRWCVVLQCRDVLRALVTRTTFQLPKLTPGSHQDAKT
uniref:Uncharacterized protein n=1 Tax=Molossus molossus TaxID=27622 RepID=A0A7J8DTZ9_MOLMO|nr:hypothetical protein HJG59_009194 [Molossus molossus]